MELSELNLSEEQLEGVNSILQSEGDKIRTKYNREIKKYSKEIEDLQTKLPVEKSEEQLAWEREKAEFERERAEFKLQKTLSDKGLNSELSKYLKCDGVDDLETYLNEVTEVIEKQISETKPSYKPSSHASLNGNVTKEQFKQMNCMERTNLYNTNKELYDILSQ
ncbi:UNVERIFIED_ORG: hypothetical protein B2H93_14775 [Clostridium botulinum]